MTTIDAEKFKEQFLALLDELDDEGLVSRSEASLSRR